MKNSKLTSSDVAAQRFGVVRGGKEGYSMKEVDLFLDKIEVALSGHEKEVEKISQDAAQKQAMVDELVSRVNASEEKVAITVGELNSVKQTHASTLNDLAETKDQLEIQVSRNDELVSKLSAQSSQSTGDDTLREEFNSLQQRYNDLLGQYEALSSATEVGEPATSVEPAMNVSEASGVAASILANASEVAERVVQEANDHRDEVLATTDAAVAQVRADLEREVEETKKNVAEMKGTAFANLEEEKRDLEASVKSLRAFELGFKEDLEKYLGNLHQTIVNYVPTKVHEEESTEPTGAESTRADDTHESSDAEGDVVVDDVTTETHAIAEDNDTDALESEVAESTDVDTDESLDDGSDDVVASNEVHVIDVVESTENDEEDDIIR